MLSAIEALQLKWYHRATEESIKWQEYFPYPALCTLKVETLQLTIFNPTFGKEVGQC
jgi:hypothetical protein